MHAAALVENTLIVAVLYQQAADVRQAFASYEAKAGEKPHSISHAAPPSYSSVHAPALAPVHGPVPGAPTATIIVSHSPRGAPASAPGAHSAVTHGPAPTPR